MWDSVRHFFWGVFEFVLKAFHNLQAAVVGLVSVAVSLQGAKLGFLILSAAIILDFATGCWASWIEFKESGGNTKVYFIESKKIRRSISKMIAYAVLIITGWMLGILIFDVPINIAYSSKTFTLPEIAIGICIGVELWSVNENAKRSGFDVFKKVKDMAKEIWGVVRSVKGGQ